MIRFFIDRPIFANVIALLIVLLGGVALFNLPVTQYPPITPPTVQVVAHYPGASAQTVVNRIALPVEQQVNGVEHMLYMQSSATNDGTYTLNITFAIGTDIDRAQVLVQNRVAAATALLPQPVQQLGVTVRKRSTAILQIYTLQSSNPRHDALFLSNYATINLHDELARVPGVGDVTIFGAGQYSIRIWLDPQRLGQQGLTPADVIQAIQSQSRDVSAGQLGAPPVPTGQPYQMTINVDGALTGPTQFDDIVIKGDNTNGGRLVRIRDVGHCELGAASYSQFFDLDGKPAAGIAIYQLPDANALDAGRAVQARMAALAENFPRDITYGLPFDTTRFVSASVKDVYVTLGETGLIVLVVILVFLQNWRATLIPATTVPVTIIGAFGAIYIMGFTINLLTLFAIVLAIGVVVDDAIVVVEAVSHRMEAGLPARQATLDAMRELLGPIAGITLVLVSVFLPAAFLPGLTGQMYRQFALVIAATTLISALNALTLKPVQSVRWLRTRRSGLPSPFSRFFNRLYLPLERSYLRGATFLVRHGWFSIAGASALVLAALFALMHVPTGFIPLEDQGYLLIAAQTADAASLERTRIVMQEIQRRVAAIPGVDHVISIGGVSALDNNASASNAGILYITLKDWSARGKGEDLRSLYLRLNHELSGIPDVRTLVLVPPPIQGLGSGGGFQAEVVLTDGSHDYAKLQRATGSLIDAVAHRREIQVLMSPFSADVPQILIRVDRAKAEAMQVGVDTVFDALEQFVGSSFVNQFTLFNHTFQVYVQADGKFRKSADDLRGIFVRGSAGQMVSLANLIRIEHGTGPGIASLYNLRPAATLSGTPAAAYSSGQAIQAIENAAARVLPPGVGIEWTAMSYQEKLVGNTAYVVFAFAVLLVFLVLAAQYESWWLPGAVIFGLPMALLGTATVLLSLGVANNLYTQIGIVLLIALCAKNAILIVELARKRREQGLEIEAAAIEAARIRFRPILMTSIAFILGALPMVVASGASASARRSLGIAVFSGMLASTAIATLFVPSFYVVLQRLSERTRAGR